MQERDLLAASHREWVLALLLRNFFKAERMLTLLESPLLARDHYHIFVIAARVQKYIK